MADIFLKIEGIDGESVDNDLKGWIELISWSWGMTQSGSSQTATGSGQAKVSVRDLTVVKYVDKASPRLMQYCFLATHYPKASLVVRKAGKGNAPLVYYGVNLADGIVSSVNVGEMDHDGRMIETIGLNFGKFQVDYATQQGKGEEGSGFSVGFDLPANTPTKVARLK